MSDSPVTVTVTVTVTGHAERKFAPNRCTVILQVHADGATRDEAADPVTAAVTTLTGHITELRNRDDSSVKRWTFDRIQHSRHRPYNTEGKTLPWQYTSTASLTVTFHEFDAISGFVEQVSDVDAVTVADLRWWITRKKKEKQVAKVRDLAVRNALDKAKGYTRSLGYSTFRAVAIADPGMLGLQPSPGPAPMMRAAMHSAAGNESTPALQPDTITVSVDVEARFEARRDS